MGGASIGTVLGALALVVALIVVLGWVARRFGKMPAGGQQMRVSGGLSVGARERLLLVQVRDKEFLIGVTPSGLTALHVFDGPSPDAQPLPEPRR